MIKLSFEDEQYIADIEYCTNPEENTKSLQIHIPRIPYDKFKGVTIKFGQDPERSNKLPYYFSGDRDHFNDNKLKKFFRVNLERKISKELPDYMKELVRFE